VSKRKRMRRRHAPAAWEARPARVGQDELEPALRQAENLLRRERAQEAIELLEPLLDVYPRAPELHYAIGQARVAAGDLWGGVGEYEKAQVLSRDPALWVPLSLLYVQAEMNAHALRALRLALTQPEAAEVADRLRRTVVGLQEEVARLAQHLGVSEQQVEQGLYQMEEAQRALRQGDYRACILLNRRAIKALRDWPPPHNNLAQALFLDGQPGAALATARQVLARDPGNVQALGNGVRFLAWAGQEAEAREWWARLRVVSPQGAGDRLKMAEAAATLDEDESVLQLLQPLARPGVAEAYAPELSEHAQLLLAVAEANTGRPQAQRRLERLPGHYPWVGDLLQALRAGRPGPGCSSRFPYFHYTEMIPGPRMRELAELALREDRLSPKRFRRQVDDFVARFPQILLVAEKMTWEGQEPDAGVAILSTIATPAAHAALRRFGLSQAGADQARMNALLQLVKAGEIAEDTTLPIWVQGEWRDVQLRECVVSGEPPTHYTPEVARLLNEGAQASNKGDRERAERLFRQALELEPRAREAHNNLGALYAQRGDHAQARAAFQAALEIDPLYTFPRCNLAMYLLDERDVAGAEEMLEPLAGLRRFHPQEMAFYSYAQARLLAHRQEYERARRLLQAALDVYPGYGPAQKLLDRLAESIQLQTGYASFVEQERKRHSAARLRLQTKLTTPAPTIAEALSIYSKGALTGIGRQVIPSSGWTGLRKGELLQEIVATLSNPQHLERVVAGLNDEERAALRQVLASGGSMPWQDFEARYGSDLHESPYWEYHAPETTMGRLRGQGLLAETTVDGELRVVVPVEVRGMEIGD